jgi:DNA-binding transcriptional MerR regulator
MPDITWDTITTYADHINVHPSTIRIWIKMGLPVHRVRDVIRIDRTEADAWLKCQKPRKRAKRYDATAGGAS